MRRLIRENGLILAAAILFVVSLAGQLVAGWLTDNDDRASHDRPAIALVDYLGSGHFGEAVFENWESEFLQMGVFVVLTAHLKQRGSPESKSLEGGDEVDREPNPRRAGAPGPVRLGGLAGRVYRHSLTLALFGLFALSFILHVLTGAAEATDDALTHGQPPVSAVDYLVLPRLWFESFQNWQSEFLSIAALIGLSIVLREHGSPESKPVDAANDETGST